MVYGRASNAISAALKGLNAETRRIFVLAPKPVHPGERNAGYMLVSPSGKTALDATTCVQFVGQLYSKTSCSSFDVQL